MCVSVCEIFVKYLTLIIRFIIYANGFEFEFYGINHGRLFNAFFFFFFKKTAH